MEVTVQRALGVDRTIDITTIGRQSGSPRRIETWFYRAGEKIVLTGSPGKRDWYANLMINPSFTFHLKKSTVADLPATARPVTEERERRRILSEIVADLNQPDSLDAWIAGSPLVEISFTNGRDGG